MAEIDNDDGDANDDNQPPRKPIFTNHIRTDGFTVDVLICRQKHESSLPDLDMDDITEDEVERYFDVWGIDPGLKDIFTATDGHGEYRSFSTKEWRSKCGITRRFTKNQKRKQESNIMEIESRLPTTKTTSTTKFITAALYIMSNLPVLARFYLHRRWQENRLLNYSGRRRLDKEIVDIFLNGGKKYNTRSNHRQRTSMHPK
jgi:hypothetical protein